MGELNFATGVVAYTVNGGAEVRFNPADAGFVQRLYDTFVRLDEKQEQYRAELEAAQGGPAVFALARSRSDEMGAMIDELFQAPVSREIFGDMNLYALADGLPVWANLLLAVMDTVEDAMAREARRTTPRVEKYLKKYGK